MTLNDQLLAALSFYGLPALFIVVLITAIGLPLPSTFALIAAGSFVQLGEMNLGWVLSLGVIGAITGDQIGYFIGRSGGRPLALRISARFRAQDRLLQAEVFAHKWGALGIFFSRWLITPLSPWLNFICGATSYSYLHFLVADISGEIIWVVLYVMLGKFFSDRVQDIMMMLGSLGWVFVGVVLAIIFGWLLVKNIHSRLP